MRTLFAALTFIVAGCSTSHNERRNYLQLSYEQFNASGSSWRAMEAREDYQGAAQLLEDYLAIHSKALNEDDLVLAWFHAAQERAFAGDSKRAIENLHHAAFRVEPPDWPVPWNDYVAATKAFLQQDREALLAARSRIIKDPRWNGAAPSLNVVDSLIAHFDKLYGEAYDLMKPDPQTESWLVR